MGELLELYRNKLAQKIDLHPRSHTRRLNSIKALVKTWPGLEAVAPEKVTADAVIAWRNRISRDGTGFILPGAKSRSNRIDSLQFPSTINKSIDCLRAVLAIAVVRGQLANNPLTVKGIKMIAGAQEGKTSDRRHAGGILPRNRDGQQFQGDPRIADFCRFLAYTGCRLAEAQAVTWGRR